MQSSDQVPFSQASSSLQRCPSVSWLMCAHVLNDQLRQALHSCFDQTFTDFELLLVTNGPNANLIAAAVRTWHGDDPRLRLFTTEIRYLTFSLSLGLHHARATLIARMDSDDVCKPDRLATQVAYMRAHPNVDVLGTAFEMIDAQGVILKSMCPPSTNRGIRRAMYFGNPICHPSVMFRRDSIMEAGGYLGGIYAEDYDLWCRMALQAEIQFENLDESYLGYRTVSVGQARRSRLSYASMAASQYRNFACSGRISWLIAAMLSTVKGFVRGDAMVFRHKK